MGVFQDILGTLRNSFRIGRALLSSAGLTAARTLTLQDKSGTVALNGEYRPLPVIAVNVGDTTPVPDPAGQAVAWSSTLDAAVVWNGAGWELAAPQTDTLWVDWRLAYTTQFIANGAGTLLDFSTPQTNFDGTLFPVEGQLAYITGFFDAPGGTPQPGRDGVYVIGSTASMGAVPITRHPSWPADRKIPIGQVIQASYSDIFVRNMGFGGFIGFPPESISTALDTISTTETSPDPMGGDLMFISTSFGSTLPAPLTAGFYYVVTESYLPATTGWTFKLWPDLVGPEVNLTSVGSVGSGSYVMEMQRRPLVRPDRGSITVFGRVGAFSGVTPQYVQWSTQTQTREHEVTGVTPNFPAEQRTVTGVSLAGGNALAVDSLAVGPNALSNYNSIAIRGVAEQGAVAIGGGADVGAVSVGLGSSAAKFAAAFGLNTPAVNAGSVAFPRHAAFWPGSESTPGDTHWQMGVVMGQPTSAADFVLLDSMDSPIPGLSLALGSASVMIRGTVRCLSDTGAWVWEFSGTVTTGSATVELALEHRLVAATSAPGAVGYSVSSSWPASLGTRVLIFTVRGLANATWVAEVETHTHDTNNYLAIDFARPSKINTGHSIEVQASENLTAGQLVNLWDSSGARARRANAATSRDAYGYVLEDCLSGDPARVYSSGENPFLTGLTVGPVYLSTTAGAVTNTAPGLGNLVQPVGFALSATKIVFNRETPIQL
jgi:hypothetical protein